MVRKRLVPFLLAPSANEAAVGATLTFDFLDKETLNTHLSVALNTDPVDLVDSTHVSTTQLQPLAKVYKYRPAVGEGEERKLAAVGEIVHTDSTHKMGLAMINLDALYATEGNYVVVNIPKDPAAEVDENAPQVNTAAIAEGMVKEGKVNYISVIRPAFFNQLDPKSGKMKEDQA